MTLTPQRFYHELDELSSRLHCQGVDEFAFGHEPGQAPYKPEYDKKPADSLPDTSASYKNVTLSEWKDIFGELSPKELFGRLNQSNTPEFTLSVMFNQGHTATLTMMPRGDKSELTDRISLDLVPKNAPPYVRLNRANTNNSQQGEGKVRQYLAAAMQLCKDIGISRCLLSAERVGGYAWAKFGFSPLNAAEWGDIKNEITSRLTNEGKSIRFDEQEYALTPEETKAVQHILQAANSHSRAVLPAITELNRSLCTKDKHSITVGKALLLGVEWSGIMRLQDGDPGYERFKTYTDPQRMREVMQ